MNHPSRARALAAALLLNALASTAVAADPAPQGRVERTPTSAEQQAADSKLRAAATYLAAPTNGAAATTSWCPVPNSTGASVTTCPVPAGALSVEARDQIFGHYCGPAVGQVIANYAWGMGPGLNKFTQQQIAVWMGTDANGGTSAWAMANGLNRATNASPRRPIGFIYVVQALVDTDRDGTAGDEWHGYVRTDISKDRMPLAVALKPHQPGATVWLTSWPREVWSVGHWIAIYAWKGLWDGTDRALVYYTDSSRDEGGSTGKFNDPSRHVYLLIAMHTNVIVW